MSRWALFVDAGWLFAAGSVSALGERGHTPDQIIRKLAEGNKLLAGGAELDQVCRHREVAESTWHRWLAQYGGMKANDAKAQGARGRGHPAEEAGGRGRVRQLMLREIAEGNF